MFIFFLFFGVDVKGDDMIVLNEEYIVWVK